MKLKLDLHEIYNRGEDIDRARGQGLADLGDGVERWQARRV